MMIRIRKATVSDANSLALLAECTFRDTFAMHNTPEDILAHCGSSYGPEIQEKEISDPAYVTLIAQSGDELVAYAQLRWGQAPQCVVADSPGEIQRLYVAAAWHGKGLAQRLMSACLEEMEGRKTDLVWLGVWEQNPRAIAFYQKFNFHPVGEHIFTLGSDAQRDIIMALPLNSRD